MLLARFPLANIRAAVRHPLGLCGRIGVMPYAAMSGPTYARCQQCGRPMAVKTYLLPINDARGLFPARYGI